MALKLDFSKVLVKDNTNRTTKAESDILQQAGLIALRVTTETFNALEGRVTTAEASLVIQADEIALKVSQSNFNALAERVSSAESSIIQQANAIALKVSTITYNALAKRVTDAEASLVVQADEIALKVSSSDFKGNTIASLINQSATTIKLQASKITLEGLITANNNFKILADGSIEAVNAKLSGAITATRMVSPPGTRPDGSTYSGLDYYGEIGISDGAVGLGLFDTRYDTGPYMRILETGEGTGFILVDTNNISRFSAQSTKTNMSDRNGANGLILSDAARHMVSPDGNTYVVVTNGVIQVVVNGVVKASW